ESGPKWRVSTQATRLQALQISCLCPIVYACRRCPACELDGQTRVSFECIVMKWKESLSTPLQGNLRSLTRSYTAYLFLANSSHCFVQPALDFSVRLSTFMRTCSFCQFLSSGGEVNLSAGLRKGSHRALSK